MAITAGMAFGQAATRPFGEIAGEKTYDLKVLEPGVTEDKWADYDKTLAGRAEEVLKDLKLSDEAKVAHVKDSVTAYYRFLRAWHDIHDAKLKELNKDAKGNSVGMADEKKTLIEAHAAFVADLGTVLTPAQVDQVKERLVYGRPTIMYNEYLKENQWLSESQKARIRAMVDEGRELAMDEGSSNAKHAIMDKYKGRINNYLAAEKKAATTQTH
jgi:hypothetical protein